MKCFWMDLTWIQSHDLLPPLWTSAPYFPAKYGEGKQKKNAMCKIKAIKLTIWESYFFSFLEWTRCNRFTKRIESQNQFANSSTLIINELHQHRPNWQLNCYRSHLSLLFFAFDQRKRVIHLIFRFPGNGNVSEWFHNEVNRIMTLFG